MIDMKKKIRIIYTVLFFVLCTIPIVFMPFVSADETAESRKLSEMPSFTTEDGRVNLEWPSQYETYLSEHFAFRQDLVTLDSITKSEIFAVSSNEKVIVGKNDWLYFYSTIDDYLARNTLTQRGVNNTAKTIGLMQEYVQNSGGEFLFMAAPNKNTVYPQFMPDRYVKSGNPTNLQMLNFALEEYSVNYLDLTELFFSQDKVLYLQRDSHWTNEGALLVYNSLMDCLGIEHDDFSNVNHHTEKCWSGDLDSMIFPTLNNLSDQEIYDMDYSFNYISNFKTEDDMIIKTVNENNTASILMYRDSFGRSLYPFIAEGSYKAEFSRETPYRLSLMHDINAQYVVFEIVERNIPNITEKAPVMSAPTRELDTSASIIRSEDNKCETAEKSGMLKIYGVLDEAYFEDNSDIYITLEGDSVFCYEAFPIFESELFETEARSDYGFSLFIDTKAVADGTYNVNAYIKSGESFICTDTLCTVEIIN